MTFLKNNVFSGRARERPGLPAWRGPQRRTHVKKWIFNLILGGIVIEGFVWIFQPSPWQWASWGFARTGLWSTWRQGLGKHFRLFRFFLKNIFNICFQGIVLERAKRRRRQPVPHRPPPVRAQWDFSQNEKKYLKSTFVYPHFFVRNFSTRCYRAALSLLHQGGQSRMEVKKLKFPKFF